MAKSGFKYESFVKDVEKEIDLYSHKNVQEAAKYAQKEVKDVLSQRHKSSPGSPPGRLSGALRKSYRYKVTKENGEWIGLVGSTDFKANWLEFGTTKMQARPHLLTTLQKHNTEIKARMSGKLVK